MKNRNVVWEVIFVLMVVNLLFGCTKKQDTSGKSGPIELSVAWWGGEIRHKKTLDLIDIYMERFPDVKVVSQYAAYADYWTKMATQAAAGNLPDTYLVQLTYIGEYASKGLMRPLQDLIDAKKIDVSNYTQGALSSSSYNGKVVGITFGDTACALVYNKSLLQRVGHPLPKDQMTYSELGAYLKELAPKLPSGYYAHQLYMDSAIMETYVRNLGCYGNTTEDGKQLGYTKEILAGFYNYFYDLFKAGVSAPLDTLLEDRTKQFADSLAGKGRNAFWFTNCNQAKIFQASVEDELDMVRYPIADNATHKNVEVAIPSTWAIYSQTKKIDEAAQFINIMCNDWDLQKIYDMDIGVPGSTVIQQKLVAGLNPSNKIDVLKKREIELMQNIMSTIEPFNGRPANYAAVISDMNRKLDEVFAGNMTVSQAVDAHFAAMQALLQ